MADAEQAGAPDFRHVDAWVFDLDNTLYPSECALFAQIDARMTEWVGRHLGVDREQARTIQKRYYAEHGTTLRGLMENHGVEPKDFMAYVHDIDLAAVKPDPVLRERIEALPGEKIVFTNGSVGHAERVLAARGLEGVFGRCFDIEAAGYLPKPARAAFDRMIADCGVAPERAAMFEDLARNLEAAKSLGFTTILVQTEFDWSHEPPEARPAGPDAEHGFVDYTTSDLTAFLGEIRV